ncbi:MAG: AMP-binding protein [Polyangiaceae bacterium]
MSSAKSPISRLLERRVRRGERDAAVLHVSRQGGVTTNDWGEFVVQVRRFGFGLASMGIERGQVIGIVEATAPETTIALLGALTLGVKVADLGDGNDPEESIELMARAQCSAVVCGAREQADGLAAAVRKQCGERRLIGWGAASSVAGVLPFSQVCLKGAELLEWEPMRASRMVALVDDSDDALVLPRARRRSQSISAGTAARAEE